ncbi:MAG TPA: glycosyltransferase [Aestuariivirgaceae bacterium]|nr:glycosyltransferase [Aestuariivirgaceae bacterium]
MSASMLVYVQHLLGIGHLARASLIADAARKAGLRVKLVVGGPPVPGFPPPGLETLALAPVRAGQGGFSELVDVAGEPAGKAYLGERRETLLAAFDAFRPDIVLIEAFPFGRRQMRFELEPLLEQAKHADWAPLVACSLRDIVQEGRKPGRDRETVDVLQRSFDVLLVHGDPDLIGLDASFPLAHDIAPLIRYTGIVSGPMGALQGEAFDVVVSAGGGAAGTRVMRAALGALPRSRLKDARWIFVTGPNLPPDVAGELAAGLPNNAVVTSHRGDFRALLADAKLSISQAGYNTAADVLVAGCRSIMVPFAEDGETEQARRAGALAGRGLVHVVEERELSPDSLTEAIDRAMEGACPARSGLRLDGAENTPALLLEALRAKRTRT